MLEKPSLKFEWPGHGRSPAGALQHRLDRCLNGILLLTLTKTNHSLLYLTSLTPPMQIFIRPWNGGIDPSHNELPKATFRPP